MTADVQDVDVDDVSHEGLQYKPPILKTETVVAVVVDADVVGVSDEGDDDGDDD